MYQHHVLATVVNVVAMDMIQDVLINAILTQNVVVTLASAHVTVMTRVVESVIHIVFALVMQVNAHVTDMILDVENVTLMALVRAIQVNVLVMATILDAVSVIHIQHVLVFQDIVVVMDMTLDVENVTLIRHVVATQEFAVVMAIMQDVMINVIHTDHADVTQENAIVTIIVLALVVKNVIHMEPVLVILHIVHAIIKE